MTNQAPWPLGYITGADALINSELRRLVELKAVFFAGLPGTGKSLFVHQVAHLAHQTGLRTHLLQWDVMRPPFEASAAGQRYPVVDGVTHVVIRRAVGLWARGKVFEWSQGHVGTGEILIGEVPLVGNRLIELVTPADDAVESFLASVNCVFSLPVPSNDVRHHIEAQRRHRFQVPQHARELEDAPPDVMRDTWQELLRSAFETGLLAAAPAADAPYDSNVYRTLYEHLLQHRHSRTIEVETLLPTDAMSVYDYPPGCVFLQPAETEIEGWVRQAERDLDARAAS